MWNKFTNLISRNKQSEEISNNISDIILKFILSNPFLTYLIVPLIIALILFLLIFILTISNSNIGVASGYTCKYDKSIFPKTLREDKSVGEINEIKVQLMYCQQHGLKAIEGEPLVDFEEFIVGAVNVEVHGGSLGTKKAQAVAARTYALNLAGSSKSRYKYKDGVLILKLKPCTCDFCYCDASSSCKKTTEKVAGTCGGTGDPVFSINGTYSGNTSTVGKITSKARTAIESTAGEVLLDKNGHVFFASFGASSQTTWGKSIASGSTYKEALLDWYKGKASSISTPNCTSTITTGNSMADSLVKLALAQKKDSSAIGGRKYWKFMGFNNRVAWCACFVSWNLSNTSYGGKSLYPDIIKYKSASAPAFALYFSKSSKQNIHLYRNSGCLKYKNMGTTYSPKKGDLIFFSNALSWNGKFNSINGNINHIGIVVKVTKNKVYTIEGNTRGSIGRVTENAYSLSNCRVAAFGSWY